MAIEMHLHRYPSCNGSNGCNTACSSMGPERTCALIETGKNKGEYCCVHIRPGTEATAAEVAFLQELVQRGILKVAHVGEPVTAGKTIPLGTNPTSKLAARNLAMKPGGLKLPGNAKPPAGQQPAPGGTEQPATAGNVGKNAGLFAQLLG